MRNKGLFSIAVALLLGVLSPIIALAEGTVTITADNDFMNVSEKVTVSVEAEGGDDAASAPSISIVYDPNRLMFEDCSVSYGGGGGGLITINEGTADITFTTLSGGEAEVTVEAVFDGDGNNAVNDSLTINVDGEDTAGSQDSTESSSTGIEADIVQASDGKYVSSVFADEFMPVGFYKTTVTYEEQMVEAAQFDMGNIVLLYVTDADGNNGNFDIYNQETGELTDFLQIMGIENRFIIALKAGENIEVPKNFTKATLQWNEQVLEAYSYTGAADNTGAPVNEFFLIYAISSTGNEGFYMYDQNEGTYQRFVTNLHGGSSKADNNENQGGILASITSGSEDGEASGIDIKLIIMIILAVVSLVLLILFIVTLIKLKDYESYDYIDEDEEYENSNMDRGSQPSFVRNQATDNLPRLDEDDRVNKVKASDLAIKEFADESENVSDEYVFDTRTNKSESDGLVYRNKNKADKREEVSKAGRNDEIEMDEIREERKLSRAERKAEEKAAKKEAKRIRKQYGENGYVDWESFGETVKNNETEPPKAKANPNYVMDKPVEKPVEKRPVENRPLPREERVAEPARRQVRDDRPQMGQPARDIRKDFEQMRSDDSYKENPADVMRNIPANDNNRPVQPKPVQQFDFDDDFEFEFLKLDDD